MSGEVDLAQETQNLRVRVVPSLGDSASTAVALVNPVARRRRRRSRRTMLKNPLGQIFAYEYAVTGGWSDPKVAKVGIEARELVPQEGQSVTDAGSLRSRWCRRRGVGQPGRGRTADRAGRGAGRAPRRAAGELLPHRPPRGRQGEGARARRTRADPGFPCRSRAPARTVASRRHGAARDRGRGPHPQRVPRLRRRRPARGALRQDAPLPLRRRGDERYDERARSSPAPRRWRCRAPSAGSRCRFATMCAFPSCTARSASSTSCSCPPPSPCRPARAHWEIAAARARHREPGLRHRARAGRPARERPPHLRPYDDRRPLGRSPRRSLPKARAWCSPRSTASGMREVRGSLPALVNRRLS